MHGSRRPSEFSIENLSSGSFMSENTLSIRHNFEGLDVSVLILLCQARHVPWSERTVSRSPSSTVQPLRNGRFSFPSTLLMSTSYIKPICQNLSAQSHRLRVSSIFKLRIANIDIALQQLTYSSYSYSRVGKAGESTSSLSLQLLNIVSSSPYQHPSFTAPSLRFASDMSLSVACQRLGSSTVSTSPFPLLRVARLGQASWLRPHRFAQLFARYLRTRNLATESTSKATDSHPRPDATNRTMPPQSFRTLERNPQYQ